MQYRFCAAILAAATIDVAVAHPSAHQGHQRLHARNAEAEAEAQNWNDPANYAGVNWNTVNYGGPQSTQAPAAAPQYGSPPSKNKVEKPAGQPQQPQQKEQKPQQYQGSQPKKPASGSGSGSGSGNGKCASGNGSWGSCPNAVMQPIMAGYNSRGNTGVAPGQGDCGCNIQLLCKGASSSGYDYTNTFKSTASSPRKIVVWNTVGCSTGQPLSGKSPSEAGTTEFTLHPGDTQVVVIQKGSKINWCDWTDGGINDGPGGDGARKCVFGEAEMGFNNDWSGYDVSKLEAHGAPCGMSIQAPGHPVSNCHENCYNPGQENVPNIAPVMGPGPVHLTTTISDPS